MNLFRPIKAENSGESTVPESYNEEEMETEIGTTTLRAIENSEMRYGFFVNFIFLRAGRVSARSSKQHRREQHNRRSKSHQAPFKRARENVPDDTEEETATNVKFSLQNYLFLERKPVAF